MAGAEAKARQVCTPRGLVSKALALVGEQGGDARLGHTVLEHVGHRGGIQHVIGMAGAQQVEKVQPAL